MQKSETSIKTYYDKSQKKLSKAKALDIYKSKSPINCYNSIQ